MAAAHREATDVEACVVADRQGGCAAPADRDAAASDRAIAFQDDVTGFENEAVWGGDRSGDVQGRTRACGLYADVFRAVSRKVPRVSRGRVCVWHVEDLVEGNQ